MILLLVAAIVGGLVTLVVLWHYGVITALIGATFGGSLSALLAGLVLALRRAMAERKRRSRSLSNSQSQSLKPAPVPASPALPTTDHPAQSKSPVH
jgi:membrane protein implicated in regulation of membrane protease activity